jgi:GIY-YIG catalytic domain
MPKRLRRHERYYQIYVLIDPRDHAIRYIGKSDDVEYRYYQHLQYLGGGRRERSWIKELKKLGLSPILEILETIEVSANSRAIVLQREQHWIEEFVRLGAPLVNVFGITRAYPQQKPINQEIERINNPVLQEGVITPLDLRAKPAKRPSWLHQPPVDTNMHDFSKLLENMPANLSDLARAADVSERSIMRMRDGESVLRGTANKVLRGLSQIYDQKFTLDNVTGINIYEK